MVEAETAIDIAHTRRSGGGITELTQYLFLIDRMELSTRPSLESMESFTPLRLSTSALKTLTRI